MKLNIGEWISKRAVIGPGKPFLAEKKRAFNNRQFNERVNSTAHALIDSGVRKGDRAAAFVILHQHARLTEDELLAALQGKMAPYIISKRIIFVEEFPRNQSGKVLKRILKNCLKEK